MTNLSEFIEILNERVKELDTLILKIEELENEKSLTLDKNFHNSLCRATNILIVSHLEGFIKDFAEYLIADLNQFIKFKNLNKNLKRTFCILFLGREEDKKSKLYNRRIDKLIETFDNLDTKLKLEPFLFEDNKNPSPDILRKICKNFGIDDIFTFLKDSKLEVVFQNSKIDIEDLLKDISNHIEQNVKEFPFNFDIKKYHLEKKEKSKTYWESFLDNLLKYSSWCVT